MKTLVEFNALAELPVGWSWQPLQSLTANPKQDVVDGPFGSDLKASEYVSTGIPVARLQNVDRNAFIKKNIKYLTAEKAEELARHAFMPDDILITKLGAPLGKACIVPPSIGRGVIVADLARVRPDESRIDRRYLTYAINSPSSAKQFELHTKGTTRPRVNLSILRQLPIPVAPREVQGEIVAELEKQFSRIDEAVANLQRVKSNLKRYKASVLKAAVEGRLVENEASLARRENRTYETGEQLLQRILEERRAKWSGRAKWKAPASPRADASLPDGWTWASVDQLADVGTGATPKRDKPTYWNDGDVPWVTSSVVNNAYVDQASEFVTKQALTETNLTLYPIGTLLIAMYGEGKTRGKSTELRIPAATNQALAALQVDASIRSYLRHFLELNYEEMRKVASGGVQPNLNLSLVRTVCVPLPPQSEQVRIVSEIDRHLSIIREVEKMVEKNLKKSHATRQKILASAFGQVGAIELPEFKKMGALTMEKRKLAVLPSPRKFEAEDGRKILLTVLQLHPLGLNAEQLFQEAGYRGDQVDQFYRDLSAISESVENILMGDDVSNWPFGSSVRIKVK